VLALAAYVAALTACSDSSSDVSTTEPARSGVASTRSVDRPPLRPQVAEGPAANRHRDTPDTSVDPVAWQDPPPRPALSGALNVNQLLTGAEIIGEDVLDRAEDVVEGLDGHLYAGTQDGALWRITLTADGRVEGIDRVGDLGGPVLGIAAYTSDTVVVAVVSKGLLAVNTVTGATTVLTDRLDGTLLYFPDGVDVAQDGTIYFTEASTKYFGNFFNDLLEGRPYGRLLRYEPTTGQTAVVADGMYFANGVVVSPDETYALVAESFRFRISRVTLGGDGAGTMEPFGPPLINGPDNLRRDASGRIWVGGSDLRDDLVDSVLTSVDLRRQLLATPPGSGGPALPPYGFTQVLAADGTPIFSFHDDSGRFVGVSGALPLDDQVFFSSVRDRGIARVPMPAELVD
jgi:sugar lactone lactonase YvrE